MTLVVVALDALDAGLVNYLELDVFGLSVSGSMETYASFQETPYTPEVWATVATGLGPEEHGVTGAGTSKWDDPLIDYASRFTGILPLKVRIRLGELVADATGAEYDVGETNEPTVFDGDGRFVHNWPGVTGGGELADVWRLMADREKQSVGEFERKVRSIGAQQLAWAEEMLAHDTALAAVHVHALDALGHAHSDDEGRLRDAYLWAANWVERIEAQLGENDELLVLSDHGITVDFYEDADDSDEGIGAHSWRAFAASTTDSVPTSVYDASDWIESHVPEYERSEEQIELPVEQLRNLGYIE